MLPARRRLTGLGWPVEREPDAVRSDVQSEVTPTAMTIAMVGESGTRWCAANVVSHLAGLAVTDELVVVCGADEHQSGPSVQTMVAGLRYLLPRHTVVVLYAEPHNDTLRREAALLDELLELGSLPIVVTPAEAMPEVAAEFCHHLQADRVLKVVGAQSVSRTASTGARSAA